jgi:hypothetical protein
MSTRRCGDELGGQARLDPCNVSRGPEPSPDTPGSLSRMLLFARSRRLALTVSGRSMTERAFSDAPSGPPSEPALYQSRLEGLVYARAIHDLGAGVYFYMHGLRRETD